MFRQSVLILPLRKGTTVNKQYKASPRISQVNHIPILNFDQIQKLKNYPRASKYISGQSKPTTAQQNLFFQSTNIVNKLKENKIQQQIKVQESTNYTMVRKDKRRHFSSLVEKQKKKPVFENIQYQTDCLGCHKVINICRRDGSQSHRPPIKWKD